MLRLLNADAELLHLGRVEVSMLVTITISHQNARHDVYLMWKMCLLRPQHILDQTSRAKLFVMMLRLSSFAPRISYLEPQQWPACQRKSSTGYTASSPV